MNKVKRYLLRKGLWKAFVDEVIKSGGERKLNAIMRNFGHTSDAIAYGFVWSDSIMGCNFWADTFSACRKAIGEPIDYHDNEAISNFFHDFWGG